MQFWTARHKENKDVKYAAPSQPKLKELLAKTPGTYTVQRIEIGPANKLAVCSLYMQRIKKLVGEDGTLESMTMIVSEDGKVRRKRGEAVVKQEKKPKGKKKKPTRFKA